MKIRKIAGLGIIAGVLLSVKRMRKFTLLAIFTLLLVQPILATPHTPKANSIERKAIMDAMRKVIGKGKKKKVVFVVEHLKVEKGWAYFAGGFEYVDGTKPGREYMWGNLSTLLQLEKKIWRVKKYVYNTDVIEPEFIKEFPQAPKAIFKRMPAKK